MKGGSSKNQTSTTTTSPPSNLQPFLQQGLNESRNLYQNGPAEYYPGQTVVGFSPETEAALGMQSQRAQDGSPLMDAANGFATSTLNGGASNPYLDAQFKQAADSTQTRLSSEFAGGGRNLAAARPARAEELGNLATSIYGGAYENDRNRQMGVLGLAPQLAQSDYADIDRLAQVGQQREDLTGRQYEDQANRFDFDQAAPGNALDQYLARMQGYPGGTTSSSTPVYRNTGAGALGGAMIGAQLGSGTPWGGWGQAAGGLLGGLLGGWG